MPPYQLAGALAVSNAAANDNATLSVSEHEAIAIALSLPDAHALRTALRQRIKGISRNHVSRPSVRTTRTSKAHRTLTELMLIAMGEATSPA